MKILFVCTENTYKSPIAKGILKSKLLKKGIHATIDSAGFESYYINDPPDPKAIIIAKENGIDISNNRCRLFVADDFDNFDVIYVMNAINYKEIQYFARNKNEMQKVKYLLSILDGKNKAVPDAFFKGKNNLEKVYKIIEKACEKIAESIQN